jgi:hypothetical protein
MVLVGVSKPLTNYRKNCTNRWEEIGLHLFDWIYDINFNYPFTLFRKYQSNMSLLLAQNRTQNHTQNRTLVVVHQSHSVSNCFYQKIAHKWYAFGQNAEKSWSEQIDDLGKSIPLSVAAEGIALVTSCTQFSRPFFKIVWSLPPCSNLWNYIFLHGIIEKHDENKEDLYLKASFSIDLNIFVFDIFISRAS